MTDPSDSTPTISEATEQVIQGALKAANDAQLTPVHAQRMTTVLLTLILARLETISDQLASPQKLP